MATVEIYQLLVTPGLFMYFSEIGYLQKSILDEGVTSVPYICLV